jgi:DNA-binding transcriptional ArsR family regulator
LSTEEDTYTTIFKAMQHPIRRRILRALSSVPASYTEILRDLNIDNGLLNYHLDNMKDLITKNEDEKYTLSEFGRATLNLVRGVEEPIKKSEEAKKSTPELSRMRVMVALLLVSLVAVSGLYIELNNRYNAIQTASLNMEMTELVNLSLGELAGRIESITHFLNDSEKPVLPILSNDFLSGVYIPNDVKGFPVQVFGEDKIQQYSGYQQYYKFTKAEIKSDQASIQIRSVPNYVTGTPPFGVDITMNFVKISGDWKASSIEGGVFPEG